MRITALILVVFLMACNNPKTAGKPSENNESADSVAYIDSVSRYEYERQKHIADSLENAEKIKDSLRQK